MMKVADIQRQETVAVRCNVGDCAGKCGKKGRDLMLG